jgi:hypothetical protein
VTHVVFSACAEPLMVGNATLSLPEKGTAGTATIAEFGANSGDALRLALERLRGAGLVNFHTLEKQAGG